VADLIAQTPCTDLLPIQFGTCSLNQLLPPAITSIALSPARQKQVSKALKESCGMAFPAPNRATGKQGARCIWFGPDQAMLLAPAPPPIAGATLCDQSDGWAVMQLSGADATNVLARLVPVDLRAPAFARNHTARTLLGHMPVSITRTGSAAFDIMVFRSMAQSAVHEIGQAMAALHALNTQTTAG